MIKGYAIRVPIRDWHLSKGPQEITDIFDSYRAWLEKNVGKQTGRWDWQTGDLHACGVFFANEKDAVAFKLAFEI